MSERAAVAWHESGHAIAGELHDLPTRSVSIAPNAHSGGRSLLSTTTGHLPTWRVAAWVLCGPAAERLYRGGAERYGGDDVAFLRALLATKGAHAADSERQYAALADAEVLLHRSWIGIVAEALLVRETLTAHEVRTLRPREDR